MSFDAVKTLAALSSEPCYKLLDIFIVGEVAQFRQFEKENPGFFEANGKLHFFSARCAYTEASLYDEKHDPITDLF